MNEEINGIFEEVIKFVERTLKKENAKPAELKAATDLAQFLMVNYWK